MKKKSLELQLRRQNHGSWPAFSDAIKSTWCGDGCLIVTFHRGKTGDVSSEACKRTEVPYGSANLCCRHTSCIMERATYAVPTNRTVVNTLWYFSQWTSPRRDRPYCSNDKKNTQQHKTFTAGKLQRSVFSYFSTPLVKCCIFSTNPTTLSSLPSTREIKLCQQNLNGS